MSKKKATEKTEFKPPTEKSVNVRVKLKHIEHVELRKSQQQYSINIEKHDVTFCHGPAGTSKTFTACYTALKLLAEKKIKKVILCKPIQESGEKLGFLPGGIEDKIDPFMQSYISNLKKIVGEDITTRLLDRGLIVFKPLAYMRGDTFDDSLMILDEAQNATFKQLMLFITRMGKTSKVLVTGDISQYDIPKKSAGLPGFIKMMDGIDGVKNFVFTEEDIVRAEILKKIVRRYEKYKPLNDI
jgi:phosphate starvation-inducible protein PhoH and related proteins